MSAFIAPPSGVVAGPLVVKGPITLAGSNSSSLGVDVAVGDGDLLIGPNQAGSIRLGKGFTQKIGFYGSAGVVQAAAPVTLADVIAVIRNCGLSA